MLIFFSSFSLSLFAVKDGACAAKRRVVYGGGRAITGGRRAGHYGADHSQRTGHVLHRQLGVVMRPIQRFGSLARATPSINKRTNLIPSMHI